MNNFRNELEQLLNRYSEENMSNTPDFILAEYLYACLTAYNDTIVKRAKWYGRMDEPGRGSVPYAGPEKFEDKPIDDGPQDDPAPTEKEG